MRQASRVLAGSIVSIVAVGSATPARADAPPLVSFSAFSKMKIQVNDLTEEPINGFIPQVVIGLTDEQNSNDAYIGYGVKSSSPGGRTLPVSAAPYYALATLDTGSQADIITYGDAQQFNFDAAGRAGGNTQAVQGASGEEDLTVTGAIGVYATDISNATVTAGKISSVAPGSLKGQYSVPVLTANPEDQLPNILGSPILSQYRVTIQNTAPRHITVGGVTTRTPAVGLSDFSTSLPSGYSKLTLKTTDAGPPDSPYWLGLSGDGGPNKPDTPGGWTSLVTNGGVALTRNGTTTSNQTFLFDTGAQLSLISNDTAANLGIYNASASSADFVVQVLGVGGVTDVPGYYVNNLTITTQGGPISLNHVPVLVLDVADPRDPSSPIPGILGTNLFNDRDLIINTNVDATGQTYVAFGPQWAWKTNGSGSWSAAGNWGAALPNGIDTQANFYGAITSAATVTVDSAMTVGSIAFDNANRYTLAGPGTITMSASVDQAQINVLSGSHTIAAPMVLASDTQVSVVQPTSILTISGDVRSTGTTGILKTGAGTLQLSGHNSYTGVTTLLNGAIEFGSNARTPIFSGGGADIEHGAMYFDYAGSADDPAATIQSLLTASHASNFASGQFVSSAADAHHALGWMDNTLTSQVIVKLTFYGDANLDGTVNAADFVLLSNHFGSAAGWSQGDFNYDGTVNAADFVLLSNNFGQGPAALGMTPADWASYNALAAELGVTVPEPASLAAIGAIGLMLGTRRRRGKQ